VGSEVRDYQIGDRVVVDPNIHCGRCHFCQSGNVHLCANLQNIGVKRPGGFAEYCRVPQSQLYRLPDSVSFEAGAFTEPLSCCLHGLDQARFTPGQTVVVLGGGSIGQQMVQLTSNQGADLVMLSEPLPYRREPAGTFVDHLIDPLADNVEQVVKEHTGNRKVDLVIECAGRIDTVELSPKLARRGGTVLLFGVCAEEATARINPYQLFMNELTLVTSFVNPFTFSRAITALENGWFNPEVVVSHRYGINDFAAALEMSQGGEGAIKVMIDPEQP
jgi:threonine dehydrogenase-like Zn-dependent dehydrogenase